MNQQRAGGLLGQGVYGCAFTPSLVCKKTKPNQKQIKHQVGKLTVKEDAEHEYEISQVLCHNDVEGLNKPVLLYNTRSFYTNFVNTLKDIAHIGLISNELSLALINSKEELESIIKNEIK